MENKLEIVRRVDDLGRIAIPKEIRKELCIIEGDCLCFSYTDKGEIVLKPYLEEHAVIRKLKAAANTIDPYSLPDKRLEGLQAKIQALINEYENGTEETI